MWWIEEEKGWEGWEEVWECWTCWVDNDIGKLIAIREMMSKIGCSEHVCMVTSSCVVETVSLEVLEGMNNYCV